MTADTTQLGRRWFEEVWNQRRDKTISELMDPKISALMEGAKIRGIEDFTKARAELLAAFPDMKIVVQDVIAQGMTWLTFRDGRIVEGWDAWNQGALLERLR